MLLIVCVCVCTRAHVLFVPELNLQKRRMAIQWTILGWMASDLEKVKAQTVLTPNMNVSLHVNHRPDYPRTGKLGRLSGPPVSVLAQVFRDEQGFTTARGHIL